MRIRDFVSEAIVNVPTNLGRYVHTRLTRLKAAHATLMASIDAIRDNEQGAHLLDQLGRYAPEFDGHRTSYLIRSQAREIETLVQALESYAAHGPTFLRYVVSALSNLEAPAGLDDLIRGLAMIPQAAIDYGFTTPDEGADDPEYEPAMALYRAQDRGLKALLDVFTIVPDMMRRLDVLTRRAVDRENFRPDHDAVEALYHATAYMPEILAKGFAAEKPLERRGLGLYGSQAGISFTHSQNIAVQIMRCLKEVWMIVHGKLTMTQIKSWIAAEGMRDEVESTIGGRGYTELAHTVEKTLYLYNIYLWLSKIRQNPVFTHIEDLVEPMRARTLGDIGVLKCEVALTGQEAYKVGEAEFIVDPSQIRSTKAVM